MSDPANEGHCGNLIHEIAALTDDAGRLRARTHATGGP